MPSRRSRRRARKGEGARLREEILDATERLLLRTGSMEAVSIRSVADAVGVTPPSIYRHFPDKDTLLYEVCNRYFAALDEVIDAAVAGIEDPVEALLAGGRAYVEFGRANPEPYRIMFMMRPDSVPVETQEEWLDSAPPFLRLLGMVQACIDAGRFRAGYDDVLMVSLGVWARVHGIVSLMVSKPFLPLDDAFVDSYLDAALHGVVSPTATATPTE